MLASRARMVPDIASACIESFCALHNRLSPSRTTLTSPDKACLRVPNGPFIEISLAASATSTPLGTTTGFLATLDMLTSLRDYAQHFTANTIGARFAVGHQTLGSGHNGDTQTVHNLGNIIGTLVNAQSWTADALNFLDHRAAAVILEADFQRSLATLALDDLEAIHIAFVLQHLGNRHLQLGGRHYHCGFFRPIQYGVPRCAVVVGFFGVHEIIVRIECVEVR